MDVKICLSNLNRNKRKKLAVEYLFSNIENILLNGTQLILEKVFKSIGFDKLRDEVLKHLVTARLSQPLSKYILSVRIKNVSGKIKSWILSLNKEDAAALMAAPGSSPANSNNFVIYCT